MSLCDSRGWLCCCVTPVFFLIASPLLFFATLGISVGSPLAGIIIGPALGSSLFLTLLILFCTLNTTRLLGDVGKAGLTLLVLFSTVILAVIVVMNTLPGYLVGNGIYIKLDLARQKISDTPVAVSNFTTALRQGYSIMRVKNPQFFYNYYGYNQVTTQSSRSRSTTYYYVVPLAESGEPVTDASPITAFVNDINPGSIDNLRNKLNGMQWIRKWDCNSAALNDAMFNLRRAGVAVSMNAQCYQYDQGPEGTTSMGSAYQISGSIIFVIGYIILSIFIFTCLGISIFGKRDD